MRPPCSYIDITYPFCQYKPFCHNLFFLKCLLWLTKIRWYCLIFLSLSECSFILHQPLIIIYSRDIMEWAGCQRQSFSGLWEHWWTWLSLTSFSRATYTLFATQDPILSPSRYAAGSPALFLNSYLHFLSCPWPWIVTLFLDDVNQSVRKACCHHHPAWLSWFGHCGTAPHQCGHWTMAAPCPEQPDSEEATCQHSTLAVSLDLVEPWAGNHGNWT